jgi:hypothetical protein
LAISSFSQAILFAWNCFPSELLIVNPHHDDAGSQLIVQRRASMDLVPNQKQRHHHLGRYELRNLQQRLFEKFFFNSNVGRVDPLNIHLLQTSLKFV